MLDQLIDDEGGQWQVAREDYAPNELKIPHYKKATKHLIAEFSQWILNISTVVCC